MPTEHSAGAVVFRREKGRIYYLVLHYTAGHWSFAKGKIEKGEKLRETVKREVQEESGIKDIEFVEGFKNDIEYFFKADNKTIYKTVTYFLAETKTKEIKLSFEHTDYQWLTYEEALKQLTFDNARQILKRVDRHIDEQKI